ncbi:MAG TPA: RNA methyltransferase [Jiangellaceae bacterium]
MADVQPVTTVDDPRLGDYVSLRDVQLRKSLEAEHGLFIAEGEKVVRRAVEAGYAVRSFLMAPRWLASLADILDVAGGVPCYVADEALIEQVTGFHVHRGALAAMHRRSLSPVEEVLAHATRIIVCEDLVDHANVGTIFRCAAGLGMDAVLLSPRCADPLYRRSVKVSMGAVFAVPYARITDWYDGLVQVRAAGFQVLAMTPAADAIPIDEVAHTDRMALVFGAEGAGLSERWMSTADERVVIPLAPGIDSLNVTAAAAIAAYVMRKPPQ